MPTNNILKFDRRSTNASEARDFMNEITANRNAPFHLVGENVPMTFRGIRVYRAQYDCSGESAFSRPDSTYVIGVSHSRTKNGELILNNVNPRFRKGVCGNLALMRDKGMAGYMVGLSAKVEATCLTEDGPVDVVYYVNKIDQVVVTGPAEAEPAEDQG